MYSWGRSAVPANRCPSQGGRPERKPVDLELLKSAHLGPFFIYLALGISFVLAIFKWLHLYSGMRTENVKLSSQRTERLYQLLNDGSWRHASPGALMMAYAQAFGRELDDRLIRFAFGRHRPLPLLRDLGRCVGMVKLTDDGAHLIRKRGLKFRRLSYRRHSQIAFLAGFIPYVGMVLFAGNFPHAMSHETLAKVFGGLLVWVPTTLVMANFFETAHRLVEALDEIYPPWESAASAVTLPEPKTQSPVEGVEQLGAPPSAEEQPEEGDMPALLVAQDRASCPAVPLTIVSRGG